MCVAVAGPRFGGSPFVLVLLLLDVRSRTSGHWDGCQCQMSWTWSSCDHGTVDDGRGEVDKASHWAAWDAENRGILIGYFVCFSSVDAAIG